MAKIGGFSTQVSQTLTRPANTTQYAAGDQVSDSASAPTALTFSGCARTEGSTGTIVQAICVDSANQSTKPNLRLYLFSSSPTPNNDNAAWAPSDADLNNCIGCIEFTSWEVGTSTAGAGGNCVSFGVTPSGAEPQIPFVCGSDVKAIYGLLVERGTYTPVSSEQWVITLGVIQD